MKKISMISLLMISAFFVGCGSSGSDNNSSSGGSTDLASYDAIKGLYNAGSRDNNATYNYLDISTAGKLTPLTYFASAECAQPAVDGEANFVLAGKTLSQDKSAKEYSTMVDAKKLAWRYGDTGLTTLNYAGSFTGSRISLSANNVNINVSKDKSMPITLCDANFTSTTLAQKLLAVDSWHIVDKDEDENATAAITLTFHDTNLTLLSQGFRGVNLTEYNASAVIGNGEINGTYYFSDTNSTLHLSMPDENSSKPDDNTTCTFKSMDVRKGALVLTCIDDVNASDIEEQTLWSTMMEAFNHQK